MQWSVQNSEMFVELMYRFLISVILYLEGSQSLRIVKRSEWNSAISFPRTQTLHLPSPRIFIHHTATAPCFNEFTCSEQIRHLQKIAVETGKSLDIGFNFLIGGDGRVYEGTGWHYQSDHTKNYRSDFGIALIGNFQKEPPPDTQLQLVEALITMAVFQGKLKRNFGMFTHRDVECISCPGQALHQILQEWPRFGYGGPLELSC